MAEVVEGSLAAAKTEGGSPPPHVVDVQVGMGISCDVSEPCPPGITGGPGDSSPGDAEKQPLKRKADDAMEHDSPPNGQGMNGKRKRHRRKYKGGGHHRKWKPYDKLSWEEKQMLADRESKRYVHKRDKRFASGQAMAPYNTTQFLMEQHQMDDEFHFKGKRDGDQPDRPSDQHYDTTVRGEGSGSVDSSGEELGDSPSEEQEIFQEKDFSEAYENFHAERLQSMSKDDLVREYIALESKVENLEQRLRDLGENNRDSDGDSEDGHGAQISIPPISSQQPTSSLPGAPNANDSHIQRLVQKLRQENMQLAQENDNLRLERAAADVKSAAISTPSDDNKSS